MITNYDELLHKYARLVVEVGANVQPGEPVTVRCPVEQAAFGRLLAKYSYERGAEEVIMNWDDDALNLMKYENAPMAVFENVPQWAVDKTEYYYKKGTNVISIHAQDPELLKHVDPHKILAATKANNLAFKHLDFYTMNDVVSWCVVAIPSTGWAAKVFPDVPVDEAIDKLWTAIFETTRLFEEDPVGAWQTHLANLKDKSEKLNALRFETLHYTASNGTDLMVRLPKGHLWLSGASINSKGTTFVANMPTEEVFTLPAKTGVDGVLYATKPLSYAGNLIDGFHLTFEGGKVVDFHAEVGEAYLTNLLEEDENGKYLGEVALVPYHSPISNRAFSFIIPFLTKMPPVTLPLARPILRLSTAAKR